jgi:hypothetical protein
MNSQEFTDRPEGRDPNRPVRNLDFPFHGSRRFSRSPFGASTYPLGGLIGPPCGRSRDFSVYRGLSAGPGVFLSFGCCHPVVLASTPGSTWRRHDFRRGHQFSLQPLDSLARLTSEEGLPREVVSRFYRADSLFRWGKSPSSIGRFGFGTRPRPCRHPCFFWFTSRGRIPLGHYPSVLATALAGFHGTR